jgi:alkylation response protein AidB-like acyl-CoA dehydrogenase
MHDKEKKTVGIFLLRDSAFQEVFTPEDFTNEHKDVAKAVEEFIQGEIIGQEIDIEALDYQRIRKLLRKAGELGFLGIDIPEKYGGMELDKISSTLVTEKFGYGAGSFSICELNHTCIGTLPGALFGTDEQKKKYLPGLSSGSLIGAFALTEPEAGSDALNSLTTAMLSEDGTYYLLQGSKQFITNAGFADIVFTYAKVDGKLFTAFIVEQDWEGVSVDEEEEKMGIHGTSTRAYHFDNVRVPVENVLGEVGKGHVVAFNALNMGRYKMGALCTGTAKRALYEAIKYAKKRIQFGRPICEFGLIKEKISEMAIRLFAAESIVYRTAGLIQAQVEGLDMSSDDAGIRTAEALEDYLIECSISKVYGSETESYVVDEEVQIFGGYGYIHGDHPEMAFRNARINRIWEGTSEINRIVIVNTLIRRYTKNSLDLMSAFSSISEEIENLEPVDLDEPDTVDAQMRLIQIAKRMALFILGMAYQKHGKGLREEQELMGIISNVVIEVFAMESSLLRTQKMLHRKKLETPIIPIKMTKVLFHGSLEKISFLVREALEAMENGELLKKHLTAVRKLMVSPSINTIQLRRDIADSMIQHGRYFV